MNDSLYEILLARHDLPQLTERLSQTLAEERRAREEFRRSLTPEVKAEFIAGEIVMHSPAKAKHLIATRNLLGLLDAFVKKHALGLVLSEKALVALTRNDYEPDVVFFDVAKSSRFGDDQMEFPAPDFVVEILSESTERRDRGVKFADYAEHQIREYWIIDCDQQSVEQYLLPNQASEYRLAQKLTQGEIESTVIERFRIPVAAIFDDRAQAGALATLLGI